MSELMTPKTLLVKALKEIVEKFSVEDTVQPELKPDAGSINGATSATCYCTAMETVLTKLEEGVESLSLEAGVQPDPDAGSVKVGLQQEELEPTEDSVKEQCDNVKPSFDILIYGSDSTRIQHVLYASLKEAVASGIPRITIKETERSKGITLTGLRRFLEKTYRAEKEPGSVILILKNCSEDTMLKFEMSGFRDNLQAKGVKIAVVVWSCIQSGQTISSNRLASFRTRVFIPSFKGEESWLDVCSRCHKQDEAWLDMMWSIWNHNYELPSVTIGPGLHFQTESQGTNVANTGDLNNTVPTIQHQTLQVPGSYITIQVQHQSLY